MWWSYFHSNRQRIHLQNNYYSKLPLQTIFDSVYSVSISSLYILQCHGQKKNWITCRIVTNEKIRQDKRWKNIYTRHFCLPCLFKYNFLNSSKLQERASLGFSLAGREVDKRVQTVSLPFLAFPVPDPLCLGFLPWTPLRLRNSKRCCVIIPYFFPSEELLLLPFPLMTHIPLPPSILTDFPPPPSSLTPSDLHANVYLKECRLIL